MAAFNKFKPGTTNAPDAGAAKARPRGGWEDDEEDSQPQIKTGNSGPFKGNQPTFSKDQVKSPESSTSNKSDDLAFVSNTRKMNPAVDFELMQIDEAFVAKHEHENRTINDLIQPGGARLKPSDAALNDFCKACESFQVKVTGTLLLSKLYEEIPYISKARALFLIEAVVKKVKKYFDYFKHNLSTLRDADYSNEGQNAAQLNKIAEDIAKYIENPVKPKPALIPTSTVTATTLNSATTSSSVLEETNLLGDAPSKGKQDPFAFIKKQTSDTTQSKSQGQVFSQNDDLLGIQAPSQTFSNQQQQQQFPVQSQPFGQPQQQAQPKKFNPFEIPGSQTQNVAQPQVQTQTQFQPQFQSQVQPQVQPQPQAQPQTASQPSGLNFKKFQSSGSFNNGQNSTAQPTQTTQPVEPLQTNIQQNVKQPQQTSPLDQLDDLLENFTGLDFSGNKVEPANTSHQNSSGQGTPYGQAKGPSNQNQQSPNLLSGPSPQNQGFGGNQNQGFSGHVNQQGGFPQQQGGFPQQQGFPGGQPQVGQASPYGGNQFNPQMNPQFGGQGPYQGYPPNPYYNRGYPQQGFPQQQPQGFYPNQGYGYGQPQPQFPQGGYPYPQQQFGGFPGQQPMYGNMTQPQGQPNAFGTNPSQNQFGMPNKK